MSRWKDGRGDKRHFQVSIGDCMGQVGIIIVSNSRRISRRGEIKMIIIVINPTQLSNHGIEKKKEIPGIRTICSGPTLNPGRAEGKR